MEYRYNYNFLFQWMEINKKTKKDVLRSLGTKDYGSLRSWMAGELPMHVEAILRLCNTYNIPLGAFFYDEEQIKEMPNADIILATLQPNRTGRKQEKCQVKGMISGKPIVDKRKSIIPPFVDTICVSATNATKRSTEESDNKNTVLNDVEEEYKENPLLQSAESVILKTQLQYERQIRDIERKHKDQEDKIRRDCQTTFDTERNRLMDMIERLNEEIAQMHRKSSDQKQSETAKSMRGQYYISEDGPNL